MNNKQIIELEKLIDRYNELEPIKKQIEEVFNILKECYLKNHKLLIAGNGGSAADADHIVGELMKGFKSARELSSVEKNKLISIDSEMGSDLADDLQGAFPAISLSNHVALSTAYLNDVDGLKCFAQQVYGYGQADDVLLAISTSGNSKNIIYACIVAKAKGMKVIGLTGKNGGKLDEISDACIVVPNDETYMIQELHLPIYHCLCLMLEEEKY